MGIPKIGPIRLMLMVVIITVGPWTIHSLSNGNIWLGLAFCLLLVLLGRYAAPEKLRRLYTAVLIALALGAFGSIMIGGRFEQWIPRGWPEGLREAAGPIVITVSYLTGFGLTWLGLWLMAWSSADFVLGLDEFLQQQPGALRRFLMSQFLGISQAYQIIEDGEVKLTRPAGVFSRIGGRGLLIISPASAVITEWGGNINKVLGPGIAWTKLFERVKQVINLNPRRIELSLSLQTREGIPLTAQVLATYQIKRVPWATLDRAEPQAETETRSKTRKTKKGDVADKEEEEAKNLAYALGLSQPEAQPINKEAVLRAVFCSPDKSWEQCTGDAITIAVVETINRRSLDEVYLLNQKKGQAAAMLTLLSREALRRANQRTRQWGVSVTDLDILDLEPPSEVRERVLTPILAAAEAEAIGARGEAQATLAKMMESMRSEIRTEEIGRMINLLEEHRDKIPEEQLLRVITIAERLVGALARQAPEDNLRLIQSAEEAIAYLTTRRDQQT